MSDEADDPSPTVVLTDRQDLPVDHAGLTDLRGRFVGPLVSAFATPIRGVSLKLTIVGALSSAALPLPFASGGWPAVQVVISVSLPWQPSRMCENCGVLRAASALAMRSSS